MPKNEHRKTRKKKRKPCDEDDVYHSAQATPVVAQFSAQQNQFSAQQNQFSTQSVQFSNQFQFSSDSQDAVFQNFQSVSELGFSQNPSSFGDQFVASELADLPSFQLPFLTQAVDPTAEAASPNLFTQSVDLTAEAANLNHFTQSVDLTAEAAISNDFTQSVSPTAEAAFSHFSTQPVDLTVEAASPTNAVSEPDQLDFSIFECDRTLSQDRLLISSPEIPVAVTVDVDTVSTIHEAVKASAGLPLLHDCP